MAEYYPLISRAVANMGPSTPEQRKALYERATNALLGQLRASDPPVEEADIERERVALEDAVNRVETEAAGGVDRAMFDEVLEQARLATTLPPLPSAPLPDEENQHERREGGPVAGGGDGYGETRDIGSDNEFMRPFADGQATMERPRPLAPRVEHKERRWLRGAVIGLAIALVVGLTAVTAISLKHTQSDFTPKNQPVAQATDQDRKIQDRLPGETASIAPAASTPGAAAVPPASDSTANTRTAAATPVPPAPAIGVLQRVILVEEPVEGSKDVRQTLGRVMWRLDSVSTGSGDPLDAAVRAEVDISDAGLKADILFRRNRDAALPASHTIETKFSADAKAANGPVRDVGVPEMRQEEAVRGTPLAGIAVPVTENLFLTGLSSLPGDVQRNLELLKGRNWFMMALRFSNGRRAIMLVEKGAAGDRAVTDALQAWQQG
jgi:hypothetical protein